MQMTFFFPEVIITQKKVCIDFDFCGIGWEYIFLSESVACGTEDAQSANLTQGPSAGFVGTTANQILGTTDRPPRTSSEGQGVPLGGGASVT